MRIFLLLLLLTLKVSAQSLGLNCLPLLARAESWSIPTNGMVAWWKSDFYLPFSLTNNAPLGDISTGKQWISAAPGTASLTNAPGSLPVYHTTGFINNRGNTVQCVGYLGGGPNYFSIDANQTFAGDLTFIVIVGNFTGSSAYILGNLTVNRQFRKNRSGTGQWSFFDGTTEVVSSVYNSANAAVAMSTLRRTGTTVSFRDNKTAMGTGTAGASTTYNQNGLNSGGAGAGMTGDIGELILFNRFVSDAELDQWYDGYFKPRWGLP